MTVVAVVHEHRVPLINAHLWGGFGIYPISVRNAIFAEHPDHPGTQLVKNGDSLINSIPYEGAQILFFKYIRQNFIPYIRSKPQINKRSAQIAMIRNVLMNYDASKPTVIWHQMNGFELPSLDFLNLSKYVNIKIVTTSHDMQETAFPEFFTNDQIRKRSESYSINMHLAQLVFASTEFGRQELISNLQLDPAKILVVPHGVDHHKTSRESSTQKSQLIRSSDARYFIYPAKAWGQKGHLNFIREILALPETKARIILIGDLDPISKELQELSLHPNYGERILALGFVSAELKTELIRISTAFVMPSLYEGFGYPYFEASIFRKPIITFKTDVVAELLGEDNIISVPVGNFKEIAQTVNGFKGSYRSQTENNFITASTYTWGATAKDYLDAYIALVE